MPNILVTRKLPSTVITKLQGVGEVDLHTADVGLTAAELRTRIAGKHALVSTLTEQVDKTLIDAGTSLKVVSNVAVGYNNIDVPYARSRGIIVTNTPDVLTNAVADFTWAMILAITRRLSEGDRLLNTSDVISLHVPLLPEPRHLIDQRAFTRMKRSAYLVNTARGPVVDEAALAWALQQRLIAGAAIDVYENEPAVHADLLTLENVLLVPHLASATTETRTAMADLAAENVVAVLSGRSPLTPVLS